MKKTLLLVFLFLQAIGIWGQDWYSDPEWESAMRMYVKQIYRFEGNVYGTDQYEPEPYPLQGANVRMTCMGDTTQMEGMAAGSEGEFWTDIWSRTRLKDTRVHIIISYLGMESLDTIVQPARSKEDGVDCYTVEMDSICLHSMPVTLAEAEIVAELQRMYQHGDTVIFNAGAYEMPTGSVLLDLVRRLPGLKYENGAMSYLGRSIEEIRLNGDHFFERDMSIALNNMPTDKLKSLKVYEVPDDTLSVYSDNHLIMDMETDGPMDRTLFATVGLGTNERFNRHSLDVNASDWRKDKGSMYAYYSGSDIPSGYGELENRHHNGNIYYNREFKKVTMGMSGSYNDNFNRNRQTSMGKTFLPDYTQTTSDTSESSGGSDSWNGSVDMYGQIGEHGSWNASAGLNSSRSNNSSLSSDTLSNDGLGMVSSTTQQDRSDSESHGYNMNANMWQNFGEEQEYSISANISFSSSTSENTSENLSESRFYQLGDSSRTIRHLISSPSGSNNFRTGISFNRQIGENGWLGVGYDISYSDGDSRRSYDDMNPDGTLSSVDSLHYTRHNSTLDQGADLNFNWSDSTIWLNMSANARPTHVNVSNTLADREENLTQKGIRYNMNASFRFKLFKLSQFQLGYNCSNSLPGIDQLSTVTDYSDPMNVTEGNSNLKNSFRHNVSFEYQLKSWMRTNLSYSTTRNQITQLTMIDRLTGMRHSSPANINGNWSCSESMYLTYPFQDLSLSLNASHSFSHNLTYVQGFTDSEPSASASNYHNLNCSLNAGYSNRNWMFQGRAGYMRDRNRSDYISTANGGQRISFNADIDFTSDIGLGARTDISITKPFGYELDSANRTECLWNISATYSFLKSRQAEISVTWRDILNDYNGFNASVSSTGWYESRTFGSPSMFIISFSYRFNNFGE